MADHDDSTAGAVVVGVDGSPASLRAADWAVRAAAIRHRPLCVLHAFVWAEFNVPVGPAPLGPPDSGLRNQAQTILTDAVDRVRAIDPALPVRTRLVESSAAAALIAASRDAALTVLGSRGLGGFTGLLLGSVGSQVATYAAGPVVVVRHGQPGGGDFAGQVVVGVDGSPASQDALGFALQEASLHGLRVSAVHAWLGPPAPAQVEQEMPLVYDADDVAAEQTRELAEIIAGWREQYPDVALAARLVRGRPARVLVEASRGAAMVVVGSRGRGGFKGLLLGSVSHAVLQHAECPVAVLRAGSD